MEKSISSHHFFGLNRTQFTVLKGHCSRQHQQKNRPISDISSCRSLVDSLKRTARKTFRTRILVSWLCISAHKADCAPLQHPAVADAADFWEIGELGIWFLTFPVKSTWPLYCCALNGVPGLKKQTIVMHYDKSHPMSNKISPNIYERRL